MSANETLSQLAELLLNGGVKVVDLAAVLGPDTPLIKLPPEIAVDTPKVEIHEISAYNETGPFWAWNWLKLGEHSGTHFDAPRHWISGKDHVDGTTDTINVKNFVAPVNVIDCSKQAAEDHDYLLSVDDIKAWEAKHGAIRAGEWVLMRTDWYKRNHSEAAFLNANETGPHTPGPTAEAIEYIISTGAIGWGTETIGTDAGLAGGMTPPFPAHCLLHQANRYGLASLCNLDQLPAKGAVLIAAPLKIENGTGSPSRVLALVAN
ncbi:kynurenine formamidase [Paenochrobactrum gallinarii]|uniref:Kynurenine formamidase n=1 Tax=Paenochrobactrum gallinarii TaxID=643673 RepID=A0A841LZX4_9HYPH|nr:cyclase family protein [Paenochrobactrum gallinarii]MBB6262047.1 kynurenine formamidase [Paenochrobactrum gallinarii]